MAERLCPCEVQVPTHYNPGPGEDVGRPVEPEVMILIQDAIKRQFGDFTILAASTDDGLFRGCWEDQTETSVRYEIAIPAGRVDELRRLVHAIGVQLGQRAMYFKVGPPSVEIVPIGHGPGLISVEGI